jgi:hypothetical protein
MLDQPNVPRLYEHPGWFGGVASSNCLRAGLVVLIATADLATDAPDEGSGPVQRGRATAFSQKIYGAPLNP